MNAFVPITYKNVIFPELRWGSNTFGLTFEFFNDPVNKIRALREPFGREELLLNFFSKYPTKNIVGVVCELNTVGKTARRSSCAEWKKTFHYNSIIISLLWIQQCFPLKVWKFTLSNVSSSIGFDLFEFMKFSYVYPSVFTKTRFFTLYSNE